MGKWGDELTEYKLLKKDPNGVGPKTKRKRKLRPWKVIGPLLGKEQVLHRASSREEAQAWIDKQVRSFYVPYRNLPVKSIAFYKERAEKRASLFRIEGP